jgi:hypothetical protein
MCCVCLKDIVLVDGHLEGRDRALFDVPPLNFWSAEKNHGNFRIAEVAADTPRGNLPLESPNHHHSISVLSVSQCIETFED